MNNLLENLNKEQFKAVVHKDGPLLIVAGAGTGKTTVITQRMAYLIEQGLAKSDEILALTFTEKAAGEMEERVDSLLPFGYLDLWISTFHSFGERILKEHGIEIGLPGDFKLLNEFEQWALIRKNLDKFNLDYYRPLGNPTKFIKALIKHFSRAKDEDVSPANYLKYAEELQENLDTKLSGKKGIKRGNFQFTISNFQKDGKFNSEIAEQEIMRINEVANAYHVYQQLLLDNNALDFGDLINYCLKLFRERPAILEKYRQQFKFILLDEFQDTNWAQYEMIKMLAKPKNNLVVVGDDDQSIFRFRGASMSNILQFVKDFPKVEKIILTNNYRNRQNILDLSYDFIKQNDPNRLEYHLNNSKKKQAISLNKKLLAAKKGKGKIEVIKGKNINEEVKLVIEKIIELKKSDKEITWNDFAILVRANESAKNFCQALEVAGISYQFLASRGLYIKPLIINIISYFKLLDDYHESRAMFRVLNLPIFNFTYQELVNFNYWARKKAWSLFEVLTSSSVLHLKKESQDKIKQVITLIKEHTALVREKRVSEILIAFMNDSGYLQHIINKDNRESQEEISLLNQFMKRIQVFESGSDDRSVKAFLEELAMEMDAGEEGNLAPDLEAGPEAVKILTVHAAKGLEFEHIFITNLVDKRFPTIERKEQIALPNDLIKETLPVGDIHIEEERRLFYVALTRARQGLYFSWAEDYGGSRKKKPSRFLTELNLVDSQKKSISVKTGKLSSEYNRRPVIAQKSEQEQFTMPKYFSYTQLAAFSNCPYQYRFAHILRVPISGKESFSFGKTMHSTLQKVFALVMEKRGMGQTDLFNQKSNKNSEQPKISLDEIMKLYEESWIDDWYDSKDSREKRRQSGKEILKIFYEKHKDNWPKTIHLEKGFNFKIKSNGDTYTIRGAIDRIDKSDDGRSIKIIDYKTGQPKTKLVFNDKEQLLIYQLAAQEIFATDVEALSFYYLNDNSEVEFLGTADDLQKVKEKIIALIEEIKEGKFVAKPSQLCKFCDFKDICEFRKHD